PTAQFYHVVTDDAFPYRVYGAQQDAGTAGVASRSDFGRSRSETGAPWAGARAATLPPNRWVPTSSTAETPTAACIALSGAPGPTTVANAAARCYGVVYTIAPSPRAAGLLWVGTDDGLIHRTRDAGRHWQNVTPQSLEPWSTISLLEASPFDTAVAYAAVDRHRVDDFAPYIYRTRDGGAHWTRADSGIAPQAYVQAVRADPERRGLLYAGPWTGGDGSFAP